MMIMGKSSIALNKARRDQRGRAMLTELTKVVGAIFGDAPDCIDAAALFAHTAKKLGYVATPRPVSMLAIRAERVVVVGGRARELAEDLFGPEGMAIQSANEELWNGAGHLVVSVASLNMVFDPTFRQFSRSGMPEFSFAGSVESTEPADGIWAFELDEIDLSIQYVLVASDDSWRASYARVFDEWEYAATSIAEQLRLGVTADKLAIERF